MDKTAPSLKIILVEDNPADARLLQEAFREFAPEVEITTIQKGDEVLKYLDKTSIEDPDRFPVFLLLDLNLPGKNGKEVLKELKAHSKYKQIPIIICSTSNNPDDIRESYEFYANAYLTKPNTFEGYEKLVENIKNFWLNLALLPGREEY
jgi:CheY-like chemotaxis protein